MTTSDALAGLSTAEAQARLRRHGANELPAVGPRRLHHIVLDTFREPMFLLLAGAATLYLVLGDLGEGLLLCAGAMLTVALVVLQEARSERALGALREMAQPQALVVRDAMARRIPARELVPGDLLLVSEGDRLQADGRLTGPDVLMIDESILTGESAPVSRYAATLPGQPDAPDQLLAGTLVVRGQGQVIVSATGAASALGRIGSSLSGISREPTPLQRSAGRVVARLGALALAFCAVVAVAHGLLRDDWIGGVLAGITVAISLIPEEFPMVLAIFLAVGAWRLARRQVLARRSAVIESLGAATFLCVDKTGTLTENRMRVARVHARRDEVVGGGATLSPETADLLAVARLACAARPVDPMDRAIEEIAASRVETAGSAPARVWPLRPELPAVTQRWQLADGTLIAACKGAPEAIFRLCGLTRAMQDPLQEQVRLYAVAGLRVLGVAVARGTDAAADDPEQMAMRFCGLVAFIDPLRDGVPDAVRVTREAGMQVVMITGDHPATALAIASAAGIDATGSVLTGAQVEALSADELQQQLTQVRVFARMKPEQKLRLVEALKQRGEVVAMTGDGVNDAPALQAAHIGIAMGRRGTDVAREAADLVLLDDSFTSIVDGIRLGRRIFSNLRRALVYIVAIHLPIAGLALLPLLLGLPPLLMPLHVVVLELAIDPLCALVFENEPADPQGMRRPPRRRDESLFGARQMRDALLQGLVILLVVLGLYAGCHASGVPEAEARGASFLTLVVANLAVALTDSAGASRWFAPHRHLFWGIAGLVGLLLTLVLTLAPLGKLFAMAAPSAGLLGLSLLLGLAAGSWSRMLLRDTSATRPS